MRGWEELDPLPEEPEGAPDDVEDMTDEPSEEDPNEDV